MNKVKYRVTLDLTRPGVQHTIYAKKDDALSREVVFALRTKGEAYKISSGTSAYLYALADGAEIFSDCKISDSTITVPLTTNILAAKDILLEVRLTDGTGAVLTTPQVKVISETSLYSEDAITATNDYSALLSAINRAENARITNISADGNVITITYVDGQTVSVEVEIEDGFSPVVDVEAIDGGHKVSITDKTHTETFNVMDGKDSADGNGGGGAPADWNASEGEAGHVLNRTHYDGFVEAEIEDGQTRYTPNEEGSFMLNPKSLLYGGKEYTIGWATDTNGGTAEYKCTSVHLAEDDGNGGIAEVILIGNFGLLMGGDDTGEPFVIINSVTEGMTACYALDGASRVYISIHGYTNKTVELPKRFIQSHLDELKAYPIDRMITLGISNTYVGTHGYTWEELTEMVGNVCRIHLYRNTGTIIQDVGTVFPIFYEETESKRISAQVVLRGGGEEYCQILDIFMDADGREQCNITPVLDEDGMTKALDDRFLESSFSNIYAGAILGVADNGKIIPIEPYKVGITRDSITLGVHTDGLVYVFVDGTPCGTGISMTADSSTDVVGNVDENNVITLTGNLTNGTYTFKYVNVDGSTTTIGTAEVTDGGEEELPYTNQIPISTDKDGSVYGYSTNTYLSSSTGEVGTKNGYETTGFIPVKINDVVRFKNVGFSTNASETGSHRMMFYKADKTFIGFQNVTSLQSNHETEFDASGNLTKFVVKVYGTYITSDTAYIRLCCDSITADSIITVNEEIV